MLGFTFSFIGKWTYTSNKFTADFSQNSTDNILLGSNLRKDYHSLAELRLYGLTQGTPLILWYHLAPSVMGSFPELTLMIKVSLTFAVSVGWQSYLCPFKPIYLFSVVLPRCVLNLFTFLAFPTCSVKGVFLAVLKLSTNHFSEYCYIPLMWERASNLSLGFSSMSYVAL